MGVALVAALMAVSGIVAAVPGAFAQAGLGGAAGPTPIGTVTLTPTAPGVAWSVSELRAAGAVAAPYTESGYGLPQARYQGPATFASPVDPNGTVNILVSLAFSNSTELTQLLAALQNPASPQYHHYLTAAQFDERFGGAPSVYRSLVQYLASFGVTGLTTHPDRLSVTFGATSAQVRAIFGTQLGSYLNASGLPYYAPESMPQVPAPLAPYIIDVEGLSNFSEYQNSFAPVEMATPVGAIAGDAATGSSPSTVLPDTLAACGADPIPPGCTGNPFTPTTVTSGGLTLTYDQPATFNLNGKSGTCDTNTCGDMVQAPDLQVTYNETGLFQKYGYPVNATVAAILWTDPVCTANSGTCATDALYNYWCHQLTSGTDAWDFFMPDVSSFWNYTLPVGEPLPRAVSEGITGYTYAYPAGSRGFSASCDDNEAEGENTLDVDMLGAMAPGANVFQVFGGSSSSAALATVFSDILSPATSDFTATGGFDTSTNMQDLMNVSVITNSWGGVGSLTPTWLSDLTTAAARGITVLAATGDSGTTVEAPSEYAYNVLGMLGVSGTTAAINPTTLLRGPPHLASAAAPYYGVGTGEIGWYEPAGTVDGFTATYGGTEGVASSTVYYRASWFNASADANGVANAVRSGNYRAVGDIAGVSNDTIIDLDAGPYSLNFTCWVSSACTKIAPNTTGTTSGSAPTVGGTYFIGTSISDQVEGGVLATIDHALYTQPGTVCEGYQAYTGSCGAVVPPETGNYHEGWVGYNNPAIYSMGQMAYSGQLTLPSFYDVTTYTDAGGLAATYEAKVGYDLATGWGAIAAWNYTQNILTYNTTFTETGLPASTSWSVTVTPTVGDANCTVSGSSCSNGVTRTTTGSSQTALPEAYGSFAYTVPAVGAYSPSPNGGSFSVNGAGNTITIVFNQLHVSPSATPNPEQVGGTTTVHAGASGGSGVYASYLWSGTVPTGCTLPGSVASWTCTPSTGGQGSYVINVKVSDSHGASATGSFTLVVKQALSAALSANPSTTQPGVASTLTIALSYGVAPWTWTLQQNASHGLDLATGTVNGTYSFLPTAAGTYTFYLNATDSVWSTSRATATVTVEPALTVAPHATPNPTQVGASITVYAGASGGVAPISYVWSGLPTDCQAVAGNVASFSCTPAAGDAGTYTVTVKATDHVGSVASGSFTLKIDPALIATLTASRGTTQVGEASVLTLGFSGGVAPVVWTLTRNGSSANLSGVVADTYTFTPSAAGTYTFYLNATDAVGSVSDARVTVTVEPALVATLSATPSTTQVGGSSTLTITLANGVPPYTWTLYNGKTEVDSGTSASATYMFTPSAAGTYTFYLNATDAVGSVSDARVTVTVEPALVATLSAAPSITQVGGSSTLTITLASGVSPYAWTLFRGNVEVDSGTSASATYTFTPSAAGTYTFYLNATDAVGSVSDARVTVTVEPALVATLSAAPSTTQVGGSSTLTITLTSGVPPYAWTLYNGKTEVDSGTSASATYTFTPSAAGTYTFYLNATDAVGSVSDARVTVTVEPALVATLSATPSTTQVGGSSTLTITLTNGVPPYAWTLYNGKTEVDSGTSADATYTFSPSAAGTYTFYLNATDAVGSVSDARVTVTVEPALVATLSAAPSMTQVGGSSTLTITLTNGVPPYAWTLYNGKTEVDSGTSASATYTFSPSAAGTYTFYLNATDAVGSVSDARVTVTVEPALVATLSAAPSTTQVGGSSTLTITLASGVPPYAWTLFRGNVEVDSGTSASATYTFTPSAAGAYTFYLNATDAVGSVSDARVTVTVEPALVATLSAAPSTTQVGGSSTLTITLTNGVPAYAWTLYNGKTEVDSGTSASATYTFTPSAAGTYTFYLNATDAVGSVSDARVTVTVEPALVATLSAAPSMTQVGGSSTLTITLTNGVPPYAWTLYNG
ncbi:MAG TPA: protease pro-enzyme activation domain-containing protein, partial [Thermoplasmata archaeon]|nr:protease pro-enzyme activation domain-containing protein [Thermoplasmata archaeon]